MISKQLPVLITASVSTRGMKEACFTDDEREHMYVETLNFYIENLLANPFQKIIFAENSGWDKNRLIGQLSVYNLEQLEFVMLPKEYFDISKGKGYNELLMMNMALEQSVFLQNAKGFVKVTGRYPIYNLKHYITKATEALQKGQLLYCDVKEHSLYKLLGLNWNAHSFYSVLYGVDISYYKEKIAPRYKELNDYDGYLVEDMLYDVISLESRQGKSKAKGIVGRGGYINARFDREPVCGGLQGSRMSNWSFSANQSSLKSKLKRMVGNSFRYFFPWIWF